MSEKGEREGHVSVPMVFPKPVMPVAGYNLSKESWKPREVFA